MKNCLLVLLIIFASFQGAICQELRAIEGQFPTTNFSPNEFESREGQNHDLAIGPDEKIYIANNGGILVYNGKFFSMIEDLDQRVILSLGFGPDQTLYFGSENSIGFVEINDQGKGKLKDMVEVFGDNQSSFGRIRRTKFWNQQIWFYSDKTLFVINSSHQLEREYSLDNLLEIFFLDGRVILFEKFSNPKILDEKGAFIELETDWDPKDGIVNVRQIGPNSFLIKNEKTLGKYRAEGNGLVPEVKYSSAELGDLRITDALDWKDGKILISTETDGVVALDENGKIQEISNLRKGLQSNYVKRMLYDHQGNLWLALDFGVSVIDLNSPVTYFGGEFGVNSNVDNIIESGREFYIGTASGLLSWSYEEKKFLEVSGFSGEVWSIAEAKKSNGKNSLIILGAKSVLEYEQGKGFETLLKTSPYYIHQSLNDPRRYWIGTENGFITIIDHDGFMTEEHRNEAMNLDIRKIQTDGNGNIWMGSDEFGAFKIQIDENSGKPDFENRIQYDSTSGLATGDPYPILFNDQIIFGTTDGLFQYDEQRDAFSPAEISSLNGEVNTNYFYCLGPDESRLWAVTFDFGINDFQNGFLQDGIGLVYKPFKETTEATIHTIYSSRENSDVWFGGELGLYGIMNNGESYLDYRIECNLEKLTFGSDSVLFGGFGPMNTGNVIIPYSTKPLTFQFSATSFKKRDGLNFKYRLMGFEESWSEWKEKNDVVYTNLSGGKYMLEVVARDFFGIESPILRYQFRVLPPWYQTWWAYSMYGIFFVGFVYGAVTVSNRGLRMIIKEKTKEITAQKDEIELQNSELESQNEEIMAQRDQLEEQNQVIGNKNRQITDSIHYAQRIQLAILPPPIKIRELLPNSSIMYRPKDIVSGDFFWIEKGRGKNEGKTLVASVDCTGHGVPGAFVSIIGYNGLNRVVRESEALETGHILDSLNEIVTKTLNPTGGDENEVKDGMDISLCALDHKSLSVEYSGAHNSLYIIRKEPDPIKVNSEPLQPIIEGDNGAFLFEIKADKMPIGAFEKEGQFSTKAFQGKKDDLLFLFTDGFADQFGGPRGKKYMYRSFKKFLLQQIDEPISQINSNLEKEYESWKGDQEQLDDVCIIAVRV